MQTTPLRLTFLIITIAMMASRQLLAVSLPVPPDLTQSNAVDHTLTYNLGATGLRGWIFTKPVNYLDGLQGRTTAASRQILVTHVGPKSPADGVMQVDDVILGAGGKLFSDDARKSMAVAIQEAEKETKDGILKLTCWRAGKTQEVQLKLRVMGTYSVTAPYNCPKSKRIFEEACKVLEKEPLNENWNGAITGLALLATGNPDYLPKVRELARKMGPTTLKLELKDGMVVWNWGYRNLFLCEYYLLTGDKEVLHAINEYTVTLAKGQSMYGTFGHGISVLTPDGKLHGSIPPYGPVNEAGLPANLSIIMGKKCGVKDPEIDPAIERASRFFGYYVDKGAIPYGEHEPWPYHENNGKCSMSAVLFALQGNRIRETQFFAKMATAGYKNREYGHTGQGFSYLWGALGANAGGPDAATAFFKEASWHFDLVRRCDGSFTYDGCEQYGPGKTDDNTYYGKSDYYGLSPAATYVLTYSLPLKKLYITGKDANNANWLSKEKAVEAIVSGRFDLDCKQKSPQELVTAFSDWSPIVRGWAAEELAQRPEAEAMVPALIRMAEGPNAHIRQGACETLGYLKNADAAPVLARHLTDPDVWVRSKAAKALQNLGAASLPQLTEMLKAFITNATDPNVILWDDPVQISNGHLAFVLFGNPIRNHFSLAADTINASKTLLYPAVKAGLKQPDSLPRSGVAGFVKNRFTLEDVQVLMPDIIEVAAKECQADTMWSMDPRAAGISTLAKYHIAEGISVGLDMMITPAGFGWGEKRFKIAALNALATYGTAARWTLPTLKGYLSTWKPTSSEYTNLVSTIAVIESATNTPALIPGRGQPAGHGR